MNMTTLDTAAATVRAVCTPYPEISPSKVDLVSEIIQNGQLTEEQIGRVREIVRDQNAALEPPMPVAEAARLLGISRAALHYHVRAGHIRRCSVAGAARGRGVVAADVRAILNGRAA